MPRPPRKKLPSSTANFQGAKPPIAATESPPRRNPGRQASERVSNSDDSEGLVTTINNLKRRKVVAEGDVIMSGGLGEGDVKNAFGQPGGHRQRPVKTKIALNPAHVEALEGLKRRRDEALKAQKEEGQVPGTAIEETEQVSDQPVTRTEDVHGIQAGNPTITTEPKTHGTPAIDSSVLAIANFKRRPRQTSILRMVQQDSEDDDASLGDFAPEDESTPLNLSKSYSTVPTETAPESPLHSSSSPNLRKRKLSTQELQVPRSSPPLSTPIIQSTAEDEQEEELEQISETESQDLPAHPHEARSPASRAATPELPSETMAPPQSSSPSHQDIPVFQNQRSITSPKIPVRRAQPSRKAPGPNSAASSDVDAAADDDDTRTPSETRNPKSRKAPTHTKKPKQKQKQQQPITTASLQSLLPRRRHRREAQNEFDLPSSSSSNSDVEELDTSNLGPEDDELTHAPTTTTTTKKKPNIRSKTQAHQPARKPSPTKRAAPTTKKAANAAKPISIEDKGPTRTYTRRVISSDKENNAEAVAAGEGNDDDDDDEDGGGDGSLSTIVAGEEDVLNNNTRGNLVGTKGGAAATEMRILAKKFREVDKWEMEFEEITASSSSPWDAR